MLTCAKHEDDPGAQRPDELHRALKARAAMEGRTLSDYILAELPRLADKPSPSRCSPGCAHDRRSADRRGRGADPRRARAALMLVIDASAATELLLAARRLRRSPLTSPKQRARSARSAPHRRRDRERRARPGRLGRRGAERGEEAIADLLDLPLARYPHDILLPRIWELRGQLLRIRRRPTSRSPRD
jgi:predicted nucleic acid-binding protein